ARVRPCASAAGPGRLSGLRPTHDVVPPVPAVVLSHVRAVSVTRPYEPPERQGFIGKRTVRATGFIPRRSSSGGGVLVSERPGERHVEDDRREDDAEAHDGQRRDLEGLLVLLIEVTDQ